MRKHDNIFFVLSSVNLSRTYCVSKEKIFLCFLYFFFFFFFFVTVILSSSPSHKKIKISKKSGRRGELSYWDRCNCGVMLVFD